MFFVRYNEIESGNCETKKILEHRKCRNVDLILIYVFYTLKIFRKKLQVTFWESVQCFSGYTKLYYYFFSEKPA